MNEYDARCAANRHATQVTGYTYVTLPPRTEARMLHERWLAAYYGKFIELCKEREHVRYAEERYLQAMTYLLTGD